MKLKLLVAMLAVLLLAGAVLYYQGLTPQNMSPVAAGDQADTNAPLFPDVAFTAPDGHSFRLADVKEPVVLVHFWAAWCAVCHTEFPDLLKYVEHAKGWIALVSVSLDDNYAASQKVLDKALAADHLGSSAPHLYWAWDRTKALSLHGFDTVKVPETIVVKNGHMVDKIVGVAPWAAATANP